MATTMGVDRETFFHERSFEESVIKANHSHTLFFDQGNPIRSLEQLVKTIEESSDDTLVIIRGRMTPPAFYSPVNHLKRGKVVPIPRYDNDLVGPTSLRQQQVQRLPLDLYVGYTFMNPNNQEANRVLLTFCVEAARRFVWSNRSRDPKDHVKVKGKIYHSKAESPKYGHTADVEVPSKSNPDYTYPFKLVGLAIDRKHQYECWRRIESDKHVGGIKIKGRYTDCRFKYYGELTHRRPKMTLWCPHEQLAHMAVTERIRIEKGYVILQPFALPSKKAVIFNNKLRNAVFVQEVKKDKKGRTRIHHRPLYLNEKEMFHWGHVFLHPNENIFYAKNMLQYDVW